MEPSMKEIAAWLREASVIARQWHEEYTSNGRKFFTTNLLACIKRFEYRAAQVEAMGEKKCRDCEYCFVVGSGYKRCDCPYVPAALFQGWVTENFGCVHWKRKEV